MRYASAAGRWVIAATVLGSGMAAIDATVVGIALPTIGREFHASVGAVEWVVTGYLLTLSAWLLLGGSLGDRYGRRRVFLVGVAWFTVASAACAAAPNVAVLIVTRALQGAGAALLTPGSLAIIEATFDPTDRGRAIGAWSGLGGVATAAGPLLGGYLIAAASWRWVFLINVPLGALVLWISSRHVPESRDPAAPRRVDWAGGLLVVLALALVTFALVEGQTRGWTSTGVIASLVVGAAALAAFVVVEQRAESPMLSPAVFRVRQFSVTNVATFLIYGALGGVLFLLPVELQVVDRYSALKAGLALIPLTVVMLLLSARSGRLASRIGPRLQMSVGPVVIAAGVAMLGRTTTDRSYSTGVLPAVLVFGLGLAITVAPLTATALSALPGTQAGIASAVNNDVARVGGLVAVAVLPALAGISGSAYLQPDRLSSAFRVAVFVASGWCVLAGAVAAVGLRAPRLPREPGVGVPARVESSLHCALDATPLRVEQ